MRGTKKSERRSAKPGVNKDSFVKRICNLLTGKAKLRGTKNEDEDIPPEEDESTPIETPPPEKAPEIDEIWPPQRIDLLNRLWGEGFTIPGGAEYVLSFTQLLSLDESKSVLFPGVGFGGAARTMTKNSGVWVTGFEDNKFMAEQGKEMSKMAGMAKKASVSLYDPENAKFKENAYNAVVSFESFYRVSDKEEFYNKLVDALYVDGFLLFTDFVTLSDGKGAEKVQQWSEKAFREPHLWTAEKTSSFLSSLPLNLHISEDITERYRKMIFMGWFEFVSTLTKAELTPDFVKVIFSECEYWTHRLSALDSGGLRLFRFEASKIKMKKPLS